MIPIRRRFRRQGGFTLMEILVALAVVSTAATIFISLFGSSLTLSRATRSQAVAASLAQEQLDGMLRNASKYVWTLDGAEPGQMIEVLPAGAPAQAATADAPSGQAFDALVVVPVDPQASKREESFYQKFRWQAYATLPKPDSNYVDVTVVVRWKDSTKEKSFALTSSAPRFALGSETSVARAGGKI